MPTFSLQIQTVLYNNSKQSVLRSAYAFQDAVEYAKNKGVLSSAVLTYGDSSTEPLFSEAEIDLLNRDIEPCLKVRYTFFNKNMGSAGGQNALAKGSGADYLFIINPDVIPDRTVFEELTAPFASPEVGITECKQLPVEHPKDFDRQTGETSWAMGACTFIARKVFELVGGYDDESFFMYCDDVDLSWRVRLAGYKIIHVPSTAVFHDKLFGKQGEWLPSDAEVYYSSEAAMLMAYKWSYPELFQEIMQDHERSCNTLHRKAAECVKTRLREGKMPVPIDCEHRSGNIINKNFGEMRFII
jgi:GT2 family glycosyltransferase